MEGERSGRDGERVRNWKGARCEGKQKKRGRMWVKENEV